MDTRSKLVAAALFVGGAVAHAGYAQLSPPSGWSAGTGAGGMMRGGAANEALGGGWRGTSGVLNVGGRSVTMPAAYRFAGNAGRFAARGLFLNPWLLGAAGIAWLAEECIAYQGGQWVRTCGGTQPQPPQSDGYWWFATYGANVQANWRSTKEDACRSAYERIDSANPQYVSVYTGVFSSGQGAWVCGRDIKLASDGSMYASGGRFPAVRQEASNASCPAGWYITPAGCVQNLPPQTVPQQEVEDVMAPKPLPAPLPQEIPDVPLPIELPRINPLPGSDPQPRPLWIPQGTPAPVPNTDPRQYTQPGIRATPAPTPASPWQVDIKPEDRVGTSPDGLTEPESGVPDPDAAPKEAGLCEQFPEIVACQKLGNLDALPVPNQNKTLSIEKDDGYGPANASCPPAKTAHVLGITLTFPWTMFCDFATMIRPLLIGFAWLSAALAFMGLGRKD